MKSAADAPGQSAARTSPTPPGSIYPEMVLLSLIFGVSPVASKYAAEVFPVFTAATLRVLIASVAFVVILTVLQRQWPRPSLPDVGWFALLGVSGFLLFGSLYFLGLRHTTATHAVVVFGAGPMVTAALSALILREVLTGEKIAGIVLTMLGVFLIVLSSGADLAEGSVFGDLMLLLAITSWSVYSIITKRLLARYNALTITAYAVMTGALFLTPLMLVIDFQPAIFVTAPIGAWLGIWFSGLISTVIAYLLYNRGVQALGPTLTSVFSNLAPVWGFAFAWLLRGEQITIWHWVAGLLVIGGVTLANRTGLVQTWQARRAPTI